MIKVMVEAVAGSREKRKFNEETLEYRGCSETLRPYPYPYGFITGTRTPEGDCVDCYIVTDKPLAPGGIVECEPAGLLEFFEGDELDHKILATLPGESVDITEVLRDQLAEFIYAIFQMFPEVSVRVGELRPGREADAWIERFLE